MNRSSLLATAALATFVVGTPVMVLSRMSGGALPVRSIDVLLVVFVICWIQICMAVIRRDEALDSLTQPRFSIRWQADNLVAQSLLGVGLAPRQPIAENDLLRVDTPLESIDALLPAPVIGDQQPTRTEDGVDSSPRIVPSLAEEPVAGGPEILATEEYVVARGDTFWSIAEYAFGDGRHWKLVQELNLGREVAPGIMLHESHEPRIGWSILVPLIASPTEVDNSSADIPSH